MVEIIPAILEKNFSEIENKFKIIQGKSEWAQIDVCDGKFTKISTWPYLIDGDFKQSKKFLSDLILENKIDCEIHLMVQNPGEIMDDLISAGVRRILIHLEIGRDKCFELFEEWGKATSLCLSINLETDLKEAVGFFEKSKIIQLMGRGNLGEQGYKLDKKIFERIRELRNLGFSGKISVDGGVVFEEVENLISAGADILVAGSAIWENKSPIEIFEKFQTVNFQN